jgi:hypothetical protein
MCSCRCATALLLAQLPDEKPSGKLFHQTAGFLKPMIRDVLFSEFSQLPETPSENLFPAVLYLSPLGHVTGSLIDSLEYFLALRASGVPAKLVYMGKNKGLAMELLFERYALDFDPLPHIIYPPRRWHLADYRFSRVITPYNTYRRVVRWIQAAETYVLPSMWLRRDARWRWSFPTSQNSKVVYLLDPQQHDYDVPQRMNYQKKLFLDGLRPPAISAPNLLINCQPAHKRHSPEQIREALAHCPGHGRVIVLAQPAQASEYRKAGFDVLIPPIPNFFAQFSHYLYLTALDGYDENPRLLIESAWLGKKIIFPEADNPHCHSARKFARLQQGIEHFRLTPEDPLIRLFRKG